MAKPPVCKIMDYGKFKYETKKKANEAKKKQTVVKLKEVKFRPKTEEHDYGFKTKAIREFLSEGNKARCTVMFRGREITHREIGQAILRRIETELKDVAVVEQPGGKAGRRICQSRQRLRARCHDLRIGAALGKLKLELLKGVSFVV